MNFKLPVLENFILIFKFTAFSDNTFFHLRVYLRRNRCTASGSWVLFFRRKPCGARAGEIPS
jgi:hypothetical protein